MSEQKNYCCIGKCQNVSSSLKEITYGKKKYTYPLCSQCSNKEIIFSCNCSFILSDIKGKNHQKLINDCSYMNNICRYLPNNLNNYCWNCKGKKDIVNIIRVSTDDQSGREQASKFSKDESKKNYLSFDRPVFKKSAYKWDFFISFIKWINDNYCDFQSQFTEVDRFSRCELFFVYLQIWMLINVHKLWINFLDLNFKVTKSNFEDFIKNEDIKRKFILAYDESDVKSKSSKERHKSRRDDEKYKKNDDSDLVKDFFDEKNIKKYRNCIEEFFNISYINQNFRNTYEYKKIANIFGIKIHQNFRNTNESHFYENKFGDESDDDLIDESDKDESNKDESDKDDSNKDESDKDSSDVDDVTNDLSNLNINIKKRKKPHVIYFTKSEYHGNLSKNERFPDISEKFIVNGKRPRKLKKINGDF